MQDARDTGNAGHPGKAWEEAGAAADASQGKGDGAWTGIGRQ